MEMEAIYVKSLLSRQISVPMRNVGGDLRVMFERVLSSLGGLCTVEGYVKRNSINVVAFSCGTLRSANMVTTVEFTCLIAHPCVDQTIACKVETNTTAGLKCSVHAEESPYVVFVPRDHHHSKGLAVYKEGDIITVKILGHRYETNDKFISVIACLLDDDDKDDDIGHVFEGQVEIATATLSDIKAHPDKTYVIDDNKSPAQQKSWTQHPNVLMFRFSKMTDSIQEKNQAAIDALIDKMRDSTTIVFPEAFGNILKTQAPITYLYLAQRLSELNYHMEDDGFQSDTSQSSSSGESDF
jgi:hypothetical protein